MNGHVALGTNDGKLSVRKSVTTLDEIVVSIDISQEWIEVVKYSPNR